MAAAASSAPLTRGVFVPRRYDAFCQGGVVPIPTGCHYGIWNYTDQINHQEHPAQPPLVLVHGTADAVVPFREAAAMAARANATGLPHELIAIEGAGHVPQQELIEGPGNLNRLLRFIAAAMDLANAECPTRP